MKLLGPMICAIVSLLLPVAGSAQESLPFPPTPSGSKAGPTIAQSVYSPKKAVSRLPANSPNVLIIMLDDVGPALPEVYGGPIHAPTLARIAGSGISYNSFHNAAMCSPTRAALLTGRNHHRSGFGQIAELANDWDGYTGNWPATTASVAKVLGYYGYQTSAFGKWHNTPAEQTTSQGPFDRWPTGRLVGFDYFYGFLAGESSQWEPAVVENTVRLPAPHKEGYHFTNDMTDKAVTWLRNHNAITPDQPFFMYWAPGASHGPHHIFKEWADKYKGKFDKGWDVMRTEIFARAEGARLDSRRHEAHAASGHAGRLGEHPGGREAVSAALDGGVRRLHRAGRYPGRETDRRARAPRPARQHDRALRVGRQRVERGGPGRHHQRAARSERHRHRDQGPHPHAQRAGRAGRAGHQQDRQHVPRGVGLGRVHAVPGRPSSMPPISAGRARPWRCPGRSRSRSTRRRGRSSTTSTTSCRRSTT